MDLGYFIGICGCVALVFSLFWYVFGLKSIFVNKRLEKLRETLIPLENNVILTEVQLKISQNYSYAGATEVKFYEPDCFVIQGQYSQIFLLIRNSTIYFSNDFKQLTEKYKMLNPEQTVEGTGENTEQVYDLADEAIDAITGSHNRDIAAFIGAYQKYCKVHEEICMMHYLKQCFIPNYGEDPRKYEDDLGKFKRNFIASGSIILIAIFFATLFAS